MAEEYMIMFEQSSLKRIDAFRLAIAIAIPLTAGLTGSFLTSQSLSDWYPSLVKPSFTPLNWVFAPVWTTLYILMGISLFIVWRKTAEEKDSTKRMKRQMAILAAFGSQLSLNILWSALFFGFRSPLMAFVEILFLWAAIAITLMIFSKISRLAGALLVPYLAWTTLASILNLQIWILNP
jgi:benzodiazapine receptor